MRLKHFLNLALVGLLLLSCQSEENVLVQDTAKNLTSKSPLTGMVARVAQSPTSVDNVLDNTSCFSVVLPVTVIVNGEQILVSSPTEYQTVQDAINAFANDDDIVNFVYPITVQYQNFSSLIVLNKDNLDDLMDDCGDDDGFDEIECVDFNFPININVYNANNQLAQTITLVDNVGLYNFIDNVEDNEYIAIQYPISITNANNQTIVITNNDQLEDVIEDAIDDCDDDAPSGGVNGTIADLLASGTWYVSYFYDDIDETADYAGYTFTFDANGTSKAYLNGTFLNGTWANYMSNGNEKLDLDFQGEILDELEDDWRVIEHTGNQIRLKDVSSSGGGSDYLYLSKI